MEVLRIIYFCSIISLSIAQIFPAKSVSPSPKNNLYLRSFLPIPFPRVTTYNAWQAYAAANNKLKNAYRRQQTWSPRPQQNNPYIRQQTWPPPPQLQQFQQLQHPQQQQQKPSLRQFLQQQQQLPSLTQFLQQQQQQQQHQRQVVQAQAQPQHTPSLSQFLQQQQQAQQKSNPEPAVYPPIAATTTPDGNFKWLQAPPVGQFSPPILPPPPQAAMPPQLPQVQSFAAPSELPVAFNQQWPSAVTSPVHAVEPVAQHEASVKNLFAPPQNTCEQCNGDCKNYLCYGCGGCQEPPPEKQTYYYPYQRQDAAYHDAFRGNEMALSGLVMWPVPKVPKSWHIFGEKKRSKVEKEDTNKDDDDSDDDSDDDDDDDDVDNNEVKKNNDVSKKNNVKIKGKYTGTKTKIPSKIKRSLFYEW